MKYLKEQTEDKIIINKSEFIGILYPITSDESIEIAIKDAKKRYPKATHYVTAWIKGEKGEYASSNDDGEPARTAGYPTLEVLMHQEITDVLCVVIRYFGGIKLGAGGLVRAYRQATLKALETAKFYLKVPARKFRITFSYNLIDTIEHLLNNITKIISKEYLENVIYEFIFLEKDISVLDNIKHQIIKILELEEEILNIDL